MYAIIRKNVIKYLIIASVGDIVQPEKIMQSLKNIQGKCSLIYLIHGD